MNFSNIKIFEKAHRLSTHEEVDFELEQIIVLPKEDCDFEKVESESEDEDFSTSEILVSEKSLYSHTGDLLEGNQLGAWERFTSGIGSKLLKKMGWKEGEGKYLLNNNFEVDFLMLSTFLKNSLQQFLVVKTPEKVESIPCP